jgi:hypothetical protein
MAMHLRFPLEIVSEMHDFIVMTDLTKQVEEREAQKKIKPKKQATEKSVSKYSDCTLNVPHKKPMEHSPDLPCMDDIDGKKLDLHHMQPSTCGESVYGTSTTASQFKSPEKPTIEFKTPFAKMTSPML